MAIDLKFRKYLVFFVVSLALFMSSVDSTIVATALPAIERGLKANLNWTGWVITAYQLMTLTIMPLMGRISDEWGRKRVFMVCVVIFTVSSLLCALSPNIYFLILFRFLQAMGGGSFMPSATGIVGDLFEENRAQAIGLFTSIFPLGGIIGPALGGWLLDVSGWKAIFLVNVPIGCLVLLLSQILLDADRQFRRTEVDFLGAILFACMMLSIMYFMTRLGEQPGALRSWHTWIWLVMAVLFLLLFIYRESTARAPILELSLLKTPAFAVVNGLNLVYGACVFGLMAFIPYFGQVTYRMSNLVSGSLLTVRALGMMVMSTVTSMLLNRTGYRLPMAAGFLVLALTAMGLNPYWRPPAVMGVPIPVFWWLAALVFLSGIGVGMASPSSNNAALELMPEKISAIAGIRGMFRQSGGVIGTAGIVLALSRFPDKVAGFRAVFLGAGILLLLAIPLIRLVPEGHRGAAVDREREFKA